MENNYYTEKIVINSIVKRGRAARLGGQGGRAARPT